jgi:uncharacterized SAM-binding protein YcdF (DUF218 family)
MKRRKNIAAFFGIILLLLSMYVIYGTFLFFSRHFSESSLYRQSAELYDLVIVFSGDEERIRPAFELIQNNKAKKIIVSRASESNMITWVSKYAKGISVEYLLETKSTSTHENAYFCAEIVKREKARKVILITSYYHMNRSYRLLSLALRNYPVEISCLPIYTFGISDDRILKKIPWFRTINQIENFKMACNYVKFIKDGLRIKYSNAFEHRLERKYDKMVKSKLNRFGLR